MLMDAMAVYVPWLFLFVLCAAYLALKAKVKR